MKFTINIFNKLYKCYTCILFTLTEPIGYISNLCNCTVTYLFLTRSKKKTKKQKNFADNDTSTSTIVLNSMRMWQIKNYKDEPQAKK